MLKKVVLIGAGGALGSTVLQSFIRAGWAVHAVDTTTAAKFILTTEQNNINGTLSPVNVTQWNPTTHTSTELQNSLLSDLRSSIKKNNNNNNNNNNNVETPIHAVVNVAGGWAGGDIHTPDTVQTAEMMMQQSLTSSLIAAHIAAVCGSPGCLLVLPGAAAALQPTPQMIGYGVAKAAVHHLVRSIAAETETETEGTEGKVGVHVIGVLPETLDTEANRAAMPHVDRSSWTPLSCIAEDITTWAVKKETRPVNGSLVAWKTRNGITTKSCQHISCTSTSTSTTLP